VTELCSNIAGECLLW